MTYQKDGSPFQIAKGRVIPDILYYGWLSVAAPFEKVFYKQDFHTFQKLADSVKHQMTRGHHSCEFCDWEDANYGNGEMWIRIEDTTYVFPRMIWHYMEQHDYGIPLKIYGSIHLNNYEILSEEQIKDVFNEALTASIDAPYLRCHAMWKANRYDNMGAFFNQNIHKWNFSRASLKDGFYVAEMNSLPPQIETLFEADGTNFPDKVVITMENP